MRIILMVLCASFNVHGMGFFCCSADIGDVMTPGSRSIEGSPHYHNDAHFLYTRLDQVESFFQEHASSHPEEVYWSLCRVIREPVESVSINDRAQVGVMVGEFMKIIPTHEPFSFQLERLFLKIYAQISDHQELSAQIADKVKEYAAAFFKSRPERVYLACSRLIKENAQSTSINERAQIAIIVAQLMEISPGNKDLLRRLENLFLKIYTDVSYHPELSVEIDQKLEKYAVDFFKSRPDIFSGLTRLN